MLQTQRGLIDPVKIRSETYALNTANVNQVHDLLHHIIDGGGLVFLQKIGAEINANDPALIRQGLNLLIR